MIVQRPATRRSTQDHMALLIERWFTNVCVNDFFVVEFGRPAPCGGKHGPHRRMSR